mmetsp:Transcript_118546/g.347276  ORF Transcript_118546/g.347276 Transcript_118546/m.347276 type:complete len:129 (-) Transcript_118546:21-407(-)
MVEAQRRLDSRRFQSTYADHGLAFRLQKAQLPVDIGPPKATQGSTAPTFKPPSWWGQAGGVEPSRPTYEDLGQGYENQVIIGGRELVRSESLPLIYSKYHHHNPFSDRFERRGPGGRIVCDVSVAAKP